MNSKASLFVAPILVCLLTSFVYAKESIDQASDTSIFEEQVEHLKNAVIEKSPNDDRSYAALMLGNQLQVVVVSDPTLESSAASLEIGVGSLQNPTNQLGLAHYLEHMLFLGTQKYPEPEGFTKFVEINGGGVNAFTEYHETNYYFSINSEKFNEALDRFSDYFKSPTFDPVYADKERSAVNNEWFMGRTNDRWNISRLIGITANPQNPHQKFTIGNLETLSDKPDSILQDQLKQFYQQYYSSNLMRLTLVGKQSIPELKALAERHFSSIANKHTPRPVVSAPGLTNDELSKDIYYRPFKNVKKLFVEFPVKSIKEQWRFKPGEYLHALLTSEESGTVCEQLRKRGFATNTRVEMETDFYGPDGVVRVIVELTDSGVLHQDEVAAAIFAYVDLIKRDGLNKKYYDELSAMAAKQFANYSKPDPVELAKDLSHFQFDTPIENLLSKNFTYREYRSDVIKAFLDQLDYHKARIWHIGKKEKADTTVPYYDGQYAIKNISKKRLVRLDQLAKRDRFNLPPLNTLFSKGKEFIVESKYIKPRLIINKKGIEALLVQPEFYHEDKGVISLEINSKLPSVSAENTVLAFMLTDIFRKKLITLSDRADRAGLGLSVFTSPSNQTGVSVTGFTSKHAELVNDVLHNFSAMKITSEEFYEAQASYIDMIKDKTGDSLDDQCLGRLDQLTHRKHWDNEVLIATAKNTSWNKLQKYYSDIKHSSLVRVFAAGNYSIDQIRGIASDAAHWLSSSVSPESRTIATFESPHRGQHWDSRVSVKLTDDAVLLGFFRDAQSSDERAQLAVLDSLFSTAFFAQVRTEEQIGYVVYSYAYAVDEVPGLLMVVQSSTTPVNKIIDRVNQFRKNYFSTLENMDSQIIEQTKLALLNNVLQKPTDFYSEMKRYSKEFWYAKYNFDQRDRYIESLKKVSKDDLVKIYKSLVLDSDAGSLLIQIKGTHSKAAPFVKFGEHHA